MKKKPPKISYRELMRAESAPTPAPPPPPPEPTLSAADEDAENRTVSRVDWRAVPDVIETPTLASRDVPSQSDDVLLERRRPAPIAPVQDEAPLAAAPEAEAATIEAAGEPTESVSAATVPAPPDTEAAALTESAFVDDPTSPPAPTIAPARAGRTFVLLFRVGVERFAVSLASVDEAVDLPDVHPLPEMPDGMLGVFNLRGRMMPLFSPLRALGLTTANPPPAALVIHGREQLAAVAVDDVDDVLEIDMSALHHAPGAGDADGVLLGVVHRGGDLISVVNAICVVSACEPMRVAEVA